MRSSLLAILGLLSGCAGLPVGHHTFLLLGVGVVHIDKADQAIGVRTVTLGLKAGCREVTIGVESSYCAELPINGDVAILEEGHCPRKHLTILSEGKYRDEVIATARDR